MRGDLLFKYKHTHAYIIFLDCRLSIISWSTMAISCRRNAAIFVRFNIENVFMVIKKIIFFFQDLRWKSIFGFNNLLNVHLHCTPVVTILIRFGKFAHFPVENSKFSMLMRQYGCLNPSGSIGLMSSSN